MDISLKNLKVVISAGGSGIGKAILEGFHSQGAKIATCDINSDLIKILKDEYPEIYTEVLDVSDEHEVQSFCSNALNKLGGLDCLINNAGIAGPTSKIEEIDTADWSECLNVCLTSQFLFIKNCIPNLRLSKNASVVNLSSAAGKMGFGLRSPYAASKWGVIGLTKSLAIELGDDKIRVNAILPGLVKGERQKNVLMAKAQRLGKSFAEIEKEAFSFTSIKSYVTAEDIANQIMFLASPLGARISGQSIAIDGDTKMLA